jgi:hypothetical protein
MPHGPPSTRIVQTPTDASPTPARPPLHHAGFGAAGAAAAAAGHPWWYKWLGPSGSAKPRPAGAPMMRIEPKTFFANERTFLSWLHMSVTIGRCARGTFLRLLLVRAFWCVSARGRVCTGL